MSQRRPSTQKTANLNMSDTEIWDKGVVAMMGLYMPGEDPEVKRQQAMQLAAAALRYAGEFALAANLLD